MPVSNALARFHLPVALVQLAAIGTIVMAVGPWSKPATDAVFDARCEALDRAASEAVAGLIANHSETAEVQLGEAVFRLRRARSNCRNNWVALARLDYDALISRLDGGRPQAAAHPAVRFTAPSH